MSTTEKYKRRKSNLALVCSYLNHYLKAKTRHGIHSPFVYNLLDKCIYSKVEPTDEANRIETQRSILLRNDDLVCVNDLGSGVSPRKRDQWSYKRSISGIAKSSLKSRKHALLLFKLANYFKCDNILELGTSFGITTSYLSIARPGAIINTVEGSPQIAGVAANVFKLLNVKNIELHIGGIDDLLLPILETNDAPGMVFLDANHTYHSTMNYFNLILNYIKEDTLLVIDDIHYSKGMDKAWQEICSHRDVFVTIDLFFMGLVFFRKGLSKENFLIRY